MRIIHKVAAMVIQDDTFFMVRKKGSDHWTTLGGRPEEGETEEQTLLREIKEEVNCGATIVKKLKDFEAMAHDDDAIVKLSVYLVELHGEPVLSDPELEEYRYLGKDYKEQGVNLTLVFREHVLPFCFKEGLLHW